MKISHLAAASLALLVAACDRPQSPPTPAVASPGDTVAPSPAPADAPAVPAPPAAPLPEAPGPNATPPSPADTMQDAPTTPNGKTPPDTTEKSRPIPSGQPAPSSDAGPTGGNVAAATAGGDIIKGWKTWRAAACERCHGPAQEGMVGPSLIESLKRLSKDDVRHAVIDGRVERGMPGHPYLAEKFDDLYAYLKGRSDGSIAKVRPDGA